MPKSQLVELYAHGLGVIEEARLEFGSGFNVLTGETGAGKTLLLGALELCLGAEGPSSRFAVGPDMRAAVVFALGDGREVVLTRESSASGRLRSAVDGAAASVEALRAQGHELIVIHGQHDSLGLRNRAEVLRIVDQSGAIDTGALDEVRRALRNVRTLRDSLGGDSERRARELEFMRFQVTELDATRILSANELDETLTELTRLTELRDGQVALGEVLDQLDADSDSAVLALFARCLDRLPAGDAYDAARELLRGALDQAREGVHDLAALADLDVFDAGALKDLEDRSTLLGQIARKYGGTLATALDTLVELRRQMEFQLEDSARLATLDGQIVEFEALERAMATEVRRARIAAAATLTDAVRLQLPRVALSNATLRFVVDGDDGSEAEILFTPNPGQPEGPLQALASGGELSRVLLALSLETVDEDVVAVFDEVDAGVGGQVAQQIGECLLELGRRQQVLAVTHLASVAARADHHFVIEKSVRSGLSNTSLRKVVGDERVSEVARMLAGDDISTESRALARRLLETGR